MTRAKTTNTRVVAMNLQDLTVHELIMSDIGLRLIPWQDCVSFVTSCYLSIITKQHGRIYLVTLSGEDRLSDSGQVCTNAISRGTKRLKMLIVI